MVYRKHRRRGYLCRSRQLAQHRSYLDGLGVRTLIKVKVGIPKDLFIEIRTLPSRSRRRFNDIIKTEVQPKVQKQVTDLLGDDPGPVKYRFKFGTPKSQAAYFATNGFGRGIPYHRTGAMRKGWSVLITRQGENSYMSIYNKEDAAQYVYGDLPNQRQIPGHKATGWGKDQKTAIELIAEDAGNLVLDAWATAVDDTLKGNT